LKYFLLGWSQTGRMNYARSSHTASILTTDGKVLVTGGFDNGLVRDKC